ncbi:glycosyltransferase [Candidatus Daviesbacteria bacterium]|nr:glycosyltransferase [Candidatus Daviesbacteria bacterium]
MKIWANTIVNNEENFIWFSIMSVVDFVDKVLVWDSGSTDKTVEIINEIKKIKGNKIELKEVGNVDKYQFTKMRQEMLDESACDWVLILDGDEIWWEDSIKKIVKEIQKRGNDIEGIVVPMILPAGDIFHFQEEVAGRYKIQGREGHLSLKAFSKKIPGLHVENPYGSEGFFDDQNRPIQEREKIIFLGASFLHTTHLKRSGKPRKYDKFKLEIGNAVPENFNFPEVLYLPPPVLVPSPWVKSSGGAKVISQLLTPLRKIKRTLR